MEGRPRSKRTRVRRAPERGVYDREQIDAILDAGLVCHLGFVHDGHPFVIPTLYGRVGDDVYVHGSSASRMLRTLKSSTGSSSRARSSTTRSTTAPSSSSAGRRR